MICQKATKEALKCPLNALGSANPMTPYQTFLERSALFRELNSMPVPLAHLEEKLTSEDLARNKASWHKSCHKKFDQDKLDRAKRKRIGSEIQGVAAKRNRPQRKLPEKMTCVLCGEDTGTVHEFRTFDADANVRRMATELGDTALMAKLEGGDLIAQEAKYHLACLTKLRNRHRSLLRENQVLPECQSEEGQKKARAFTELVTYIESAVEDGTFCFKLADLRHLFEKRLKEFGIHSEVNKVRFKEKVLSHFHEAQAQNDGKNIILVFKQGMQQMLKSALSTDCESDAMILARAASIIRKDMFNYNGFHFRGSFPPRCQQESVPFNFKYLLSMLLNGPNLEDQDSEDSQACLTLSQMILFNSKRGRSRSKSRHSLDQEPPLPLYIGINVHTQTRSKKMVQQLCQFGLSVSYDRVIQVENQLATGVCQHIAEIGLVCPSQLHRGLFTIGALDNLDHNPSSTTATDSFHGTGISLFQFLSSSRKYQTQNLIVLPASNTQRNHQLPDDYTTVPAVVLAKASVAVPKSPRSIVPFSGHLAGAKDQENCWLEHALEMLKKETMEKGDAIAWASYHASNQNFTENPHLALTQLMPLFYEKAATAAMVKHGMTVQRRATEFLNPGQIPVTAFDAPLYALAKQVQWKWPDTHGEDKYVVMLGGLHTEMAIWSTLGDYLEDSGWTVALTQAEIASSGTADSFLKASHLTRARHGHQVSVVALSKLQHDAFLTSNNGENLEAWRQKMVLKSPTFQFWDTVLRMEIIGLIFVRAHREANFSLYIETLRSFAPWFFALDHHNYARWVSVHIRDMESLPPSILEEFQAYGHWVIHKTHNRFSAMPIDQAHEQNNALVKGSGGAVGLTENPSAFRKWMLAGPEQARLLTEFESQYSPEVSDKYSHHEEGLSTQRTFKQQVLALAEIIKDMGNPFLDDTPELLSLDKRHVVDECVADSVRSIEALGQEKFKEYQESVILNCTKSIHDPIEKNSLALFKRPKPKSKTKHTKKVAMLKDDVSLFSRLYIVAKHRDCDMASFFKHENQHYPPSLSDYGKLRFAKKSDLLHILPQESQKDHPISIDAMAYDGAALVHLLPTKQVTTFDEYATSVFLPHIVRQLEKCTRVDVVWDRYISDSIKAATREKRGKGVRMKVAGKSKVPGNWRGFLRDESNKKELFHFLTQRILSFDYSEGKQVFVTSDANVLSKGSSHDMPPCDHEEADTRLLIHLVDALKSGCSTCVVRTVDTDVVVNLIGKFHNLLSTYPSTEIWIAFGAGKAFTYLHINSICHSMGETKSLALPVFHSFTGCDTTSGFFGKGKKIAWEGWKCYPDVTEVFTHMALNPYIHLDYGSRYFQILERFTVILYNKTSILESVDEARMELFCHGNKTMEKLPPTKAALLQHSKRAVYQASVWTTGDRAKQNRPSPEGWGWTWDDDIKSWTPIWTTLPVASNACAELIKCGCKSKNGCGARCGCLKANWSCTELCNCNCIM